MNEFQNIDLPEITPQQSDFVRAFVLNGEKPKRAYMFAYNTENMSDAAISVEASKLLNHPKIALWIDYYKKRAGAVINKEFDYTAIDAMKEYTELQKLSMNSSKTYHVAKGCIDGKCKISGLDKSDSLTANVVVNMGNVEVDGKSFEFKVGNEPDDNTENTASENT